MATPSRYQVKLHSLVTLEDLPMLPESLKKDLDDFCRSLFVEDPYGCFGLASHSLKGQLKGYRALEIDWNQTSYRLVYRIYRKNGFKTPSFRTALHLIGRSVTIASTV